MLCLRPMSTQHLGVLAGCGGKAPERLILLGFGAVVAVSPLWVAQKLV